jgi:ribonuclease T2
MKRFLVVCGVAALTSVVGFQALAIEPDTSHTVSSADTHFKTGPKGGAYESLVLALAWSPTYCASSSGRADREECAGTKKYGFIAHGLWPQFPRGSGASHGCTGEVTGLTDKSVEKVTGIIPSHRLMAHEWEKHGTCFGADAATYFGKTREA